MLIKCKVCNKLPPEQYRRCTSDWIPTDENLYFLTISSIKISFCSPACCCTYASTRLYKENRKTSGPSVESPPPSAN